MRELTDDPVRWRVGGKVGRTIYRQAGPEPSDADLLIGMMDTVELAADAVRCHNATVSTRSDSIRRRLPPGGMVVAVGDAERGMAYAVTSPDGWYVTIHRPDGSIEGGFRMPPALPRVLASKLFDVLDEWPRLG